MTDLRAALRLDVSAPGAAGTIGAVQRGVDQLGASGVKAGSGLDRASAGADRLDRELDQIARSGPSAGRGLGEAARGAQDFERSAGLARAAGGALGGALAAIAGKEVIAGIQDAAFTTQGLTTGLEAVADGSMGAKTELVYLRQESANLGLNLRDQTNAFMGLAGATNGTALQGQATRDIWLGLVDAGTALHRTNEQQSRAMEAVAQIASKGTVAMEEVRGQLAESLPGATQIAARAMGVTTAEFIKMVSAGNLTADVFLPKFAAQLKKEFGPTLDAAMSTPLGRARKELSAFGNDLFDLKALAGESFLTGVTDGLAAVNQELSSGAARQAAEDFGRLLGEALGNAAQVAAFLAHNLDTVTLAAEAVAGVAVVRWLTGVATEANAAAVAYLAKGAAATTASAQAQAAGMAEGRSATTLRGALEAVARAEVEAAAATRQAALAAEQAAAAKLAEARADAARGNAGLVTARNQALVVAAEKELATARSASIAATARAETALAGFTRASTASGAAMTALRGVAGGFVSFLGGPWGIALLAAGAAVTYIAHEVGEYERQARTAQDAQKAYSDAMADSATVLREAGVNTRAFTGDTTDAKKPTDDLTVSTKLLTDQTLKLADARRQAALAGLDLASVKLKDEKKDLEKQAAGGPWWQRLAVAAFRAEAGSQGIVVDDTPKVRVPIGVRADGSPIMGERDAGPELAKIADQRASALAQGIALMIAPPAKDEKPKPTNPPAGTTKTDRAEARAQALAADGAADVAAMNARIAALKAGGAALDDFAAKEAGRQAVERLALADRPKLTDAEKALVEQIRRHAEENERLKLAAERTEKAIGLSRAADEETASLKRYAEAAAQGERALEDYQVQEAGKQVLQKLGIQTLDQLDEKTRGYAEAAIKSAEAQERQRIEADKAQRVAEAVQDLDRRTQSEKDYAAAVTGGMDAIVAYQRAEFVRQEVERAGKTLTEEQIAVLKAKAEALFAVQGAADEADLVHQQNEELRLARLTNRERQIEERYLQRKSLLLRQHADWTREEVEARARALALADQAAAEDAQAVGELRENLRQAFIDSGHIGFDDIADYAKRKLRAAVYDALLAKPIDIIINAVVGSIGGLGQTGAGGGLAALFNGAGALKGLASGAGNVITDILMKTGMGGLDAAKIGGMAGGAIGGAGTGLLVSSLAGMLGLKQGKGNQVGSAIGGAIGSFIPIPGGSFIGAALGNVLGGLIGGKKSNNAAVLTLDGTGNITSIGGGKRTDQTTAAATSAANGIAALEQALIAAGATLKTTVTSIDLGVRDQTHIGLSNGQTLQTAVGDAQAAVEAAARAIIDGATFASEAQTAYARKMLAAGASLDDVVATMQAASALPKSIDDAIRQLTDPAGFERDQAMAAIEESYKALKAKAQELVTTGLVSGDVLAKIEQLHDLQVADQLKKVADAAAEAAAALKAEADQKAAEQAANIKSAADLMKSIDLALLKISDPDAYAKANAVNNVQTNYEAMRAQAEQLIAAGVLSADVLEKLARMRDLQIEEALKGLESQVDNVAKAFADARPRLLQWLDGLALSGNSPLNAFEQRQAAMASYERQLQLARSGDATALQAITGYADALLSADREATSSAADRAALYAKVQADIAALSVAQAALAAKPQEVQLAAPDLAAFSASINVGSDRLAQQIETLSAKVTQLASQASQSTADLAGEVVEGLRDLADHLDKGFAETAASLDGLAAQQALTNATLKKAVVH